MPLRNLMHVGRVYELLVSTDDRYKRHTVPLPKPEFYTFYNGTETWGKEKILRLSDAYVIQDEEPMLELVVKMININPKVGHEVLERCQVLKEYGLFIDTVQELQDAGDPDSIKHAIEKCIEQGILADYLKKRGSEVVNMLIAKYDYDTDIRVQREEAQERGRLEGQESYNQLILQLNKEQRLDDIVKAASDPEHLDKLYQEYGINH